MQPIAPRLAATRPYTATRQYTATQAGPRQVMPRPHVPQPYRMRARQPHRAAAALQQPMPEAADGRAADTQVAKHTRAATHTSSHQVVNGCSPPRRVWRSGLQRTACKAERNGQRLEAVGRTPDQPAAATCAASPLTATPPAASPLAASPFSVRPMDFSGKPTISAAFLKSW